MDMILASQSPRRKELLGQMGLRGFKVTSPEVDETVDEHLPPAQVVEELSRRKAMAVARHADGDDLIIWRGRCWASPPTSGRPLPCSPP